MKFKLIDLIWLMLYAAVLATVTGALLRARYDALATFGTTTAQTEWDQWRSEAKDMAMGAGPVKRREPKSLQPPALVLMRDHFAACLGLALLLSTVLFGTFMFFIRGALQSRSLTPSATSVAKDRRDRSS